MVADWEIAGAAGDRYGIRITGWLSPPVTGKYVFYNCSDNSSILYLSEDETEARKREIASEPMWTLNPRDWMSRARRPQQENISKPILLDAGKRYYVESLMKEDTGGDHLAVTWQMPGEPPPKNGAAPIPGKYLAIQAEQ